MTYTVLIDDNFHYMDESARTSHGVFDTLPDAVDACQRIVDDFLRSAYQPGMIAGDLMTSYVSFGEDPFIVSSEPGGGVLFSAREYARWQTEYMCRQVEIDPRYLTEAPYPVQPDTE